MEKLKKYKYWIITLAIIIAIRIALPYIVLNVLNSRLQNLEGYTGSIEDIDLALYRGGSKIKGFKFFSNEHPDYPLVQTQLIDWSIQWNQIWNGAIVGEVYITKPSVKFINLSKKQDENNFDGVEDSKLKERVLDLMPININKIEIINGNIHYIDKSTSPIVDVVIDNFNCKVTNLTNSEKLSESMVAKLNATGDVMSTSRLAIDIALNPFDTLGGFNSKLSMESLPLKELNNFLMGYLAIDAEEGNMSVYSEVNANKGAVEGYIKPLIKDPKFSSKNDKNKKIGQKIKEKLVDVGSYIFENHKKNQIGSKIVFTGNMNDPDIKIFKAVGSFLRNAFIKALEPNLEPEILNDIK